VGVCLSPVVAALRAYRGPALTVDHPTGTKLVRFAPGKSMRTLTALAFLPGLLVRVAQANIINNNCGRGPIDSSGKRGRDIINNCNGHNNGSGGDADGSPRCEPTDANGETLQDSFFESDTVFSCVYNDVGFCDYSAFVRGGPYRIYTADLPVCLIFQSGSRLNGEDNSCPKKLERVAVASSIGSSSALSTPTLAGSSDSDSTSTTQTRGSTADGGGFHSVSAPTYVFCFGTPRYLNLSCNNQLFTAATG
jgi:hypothetical protein